MKTKSLFLAAVMIFTVMNAKADDEMNVIVMKKGSAAVAFISPVSEISSVTFTGATSNDALQIRKADATPDAILKIDDIQELTLTNTEISVLMTATSQQFGFSDIAKLEFGTLTTTYHHPNADNLNVTAYFSKEGNLVVESPAGDVQSQMLYSLDGRIIAARNIPAGIYLVRIETPKGLVVKKVVKQ